MFGRSMFREFEEDPFFSSHREHMRQMVPSDRMMVQPFGMFGRDPMLGITDGRDPGGALAAIAGGQSERRRQTNGGAMMPFGGGGFDIFSHMNSMMTNMHSMMGMHSQFGQMENNPNVGMHGYSSQSVYSYSNTGEGQPEVYQATSETRRAPGGISETRKAERDSKSGLEKMAIGRHIHERGHIQEKSRNRRTGDEEDNQEYIHLDEADAGAFNREWQEKTHEHPTTAQLRDRSERPVRQAITGSNMFDHDTTRSHTQSRDRRHQSQQKHRSPDYRERD